MKKYISLEEYREPRFGRFLVGDKVILHTSIAWDEAWQRYCDGQTATITRVDSRGRATKITMDFDKSFVTGISDDSCLELIN